MRSRHKNGRTTSKMGSSFQRQLPMTFSDAEICSTVAECGSAPSVMICHSCVFDSGLSNLVIKGCTHGCDKEFSICKVGFAAEGTLRFHQEGVCLLLAVLCQRRRRRSLRQKLPARVWVFAVPRSILFCSCLQCKEKAQSSKQNGTPCFVQISPYMPLFCTVPKNYSPVLSSLHLSYLYSTYKLSVKCSN